MSRQVLSGLLGCNISSQAALLSAGLELRWRVSSPLYPSMAMLKSVFAQFGITKQTMSSRLQIFQQYAAAVDTLRTHFSDRSETLIHGESLSQYELAVKIKDIAWLREHLLPLTESLLPARFSLKLVVTVHYLRAELHIRGDSTRLEIDCEHVEFLE